MQSSSKPIFIMHIPGYLAPGQGVAVLSLFRRLFAVSSAPPDPLTPCDIANFFAIVDSPLCFVISACRKCLY